MTDAVDHHGSDADRSSGARWKTHLAKAAQAAERPLLLGLRLWASVCLALYVAFWLELDNAFWAGTSAVLMCQPILGASMRKGWFRMIGTLVGAVAIVVLTAMFPQDRAGFLVSLALWGAACAFVATLLRNFAAYAAALAGYTAAIIASDQLGATGGLNGQGFTLAIFRVSEIWLGIVCAGVVLAGTDFGTAPRLLAGMFADLAAEIAGQFISTLTRGKEVLPQMQSIRRTLIRNVIALDPVIDEAIGESSDLRYRSPVLQTAVNGLYAALAAWRTVAARLAIVSEDDARRDAEVVLRAIPEETLSTLIQAYPSRWLVEPLKLRRWYAAAAQALIASPVPAPSPRLLAVQTSRVLSGICDALDGLALLVGDPDRSGPYHRDARLHVPDWLPSFVNAGRAFAAITAAELLWIVTAWPNGAFAVTWTAIPVILFAPRADAAYSTTMSFIAGNVLTAVCAAIILFAVLPNFDTFEGFALVIGLYLVPVGALTAQPWRTAMFIPMAANFIPMIGPANQMSYDTLSFYNNVLAILVGNAVAAFSFRVLPPLSPHLRTGRLLALTRRDLRSIARRRIHRSHDDWRGSIYSRLAAMPEEATPLQRAQLVAALSVGTEIIQLIRMVPPFGLDREFNLALGALADGSVDLARDALVVLDQQLALIPDSDPRISFALQTRAGIFAVCDALVQHRSYFDAGAAT